MSGRRAPSWRSGALGPTALVGLLVWVASCGGRSGLIAGDPFDSRDGSTAPDGRLDASGRITEGGEGAVADATTDAGTLAEGAPDDAGSYADAHPESSVEASACDLQSGAFPPAQTVKNGVQSADAYVVLFDLNGDGRLDEAMADFPGNDVLVRFGNGDGTFGAPAVYPVGTGPSALAIGDLDGDGHVDLVTANAGVSNILTESSDGAGVTVLEGNGDGTFGSRADYPLAPGPDGGPGFDIGNSVAIGDLDGDGLPDLAVAAGPRVHLFSGKKQGGFAAAVPQDVGLGSVYYLAVGDVSSDGHPDLVASGGLVPDGGSPTTGAVAVLLSSDGGLGAPATYNTSGSYAYEPQIADVDRDGRPDLVVPTWAGAGGVTVFHGRGGGAFSPAATYPALGYARTVRVGDVNDDGRPDLAVGGPYGVVMLVQQTDGGFQPQVAPPLPSGSQGVAYSTYDFGAGVTSTAIGDIDSDGTPDVVAGIAQYDVMALHNTGDGHLQPVDPMHHSDPGDLAAADLDGDGKIDLAIANVGTRDIGVVFGNGDGTFRPEVDYPLNDAGTNRNSGITPYQVEAADLDGDHRLDLVVLEAAGSAAGLAIFHGGDGGALQRVAGVTGFSSKPAVLDLDGDGIPDLAGPAAQIVDGGAGNVLPGYVRTALGKGDGTFGPGALYAAPTPTRWFLQVTAGDFDGDGNMDVAGVAPGGSPGSPVGVYVLPGKGDGTLGAAVVTSFEEADAGNSFSSLSMATGDLDGDGHPDVVLSDDLHATLYILLGKGDGTFRSPERIQVDAPSMQSHKPCTVAIADLNVDGKLDVALLHDHPETFSWPWVAVLLGHGDGTFGAPVDRQVGLTATNLVVGAFTNGAPPEIVTCDRAANGLSVLPSAPFCPGTLDGGSNDAR